jgi:ABC-type tungstate transport system substrate-binding protein
MRKQIKRLFISLTLIISATPCFASHATDGLIVFVYGAVVITFIPVSALALFCCVRRFTKMDLFKKIVGLALNIPQLYITYLLCCKIGAPQNMHNFEMLFIVLMLIVPCACIYFFIKNIHQKNAQKTATTNA